MAAKWILPEPGRAEALDLLDQHIRGEVALIAPDLLIAEFGSLISKRCRRKQLTGEQAAQAFRLMDMVKPRLFAFEELAGQALRLSIQSQLSYGDSVYIALAMERNCLFVTADGRLFRGAVARHPSIRLLGELIIG